MGELSPGMPFGRENALFSPILAVKLSNREDILSLL
jgi:hypothetical protein